MTNLQFSKSVSSGKDLVTFVSRGIFRADGLVTGTKIIVLFHGDPNIWPMDVMRNFEGRLQMAGYGEIHYILGEKPKCTDCPSRFEKKCHVFYPGVLENLY